MELLENLKQNIIIGGTYNNAVCQTDYVTARKKLNNINELKLNDLILHERIGSNSMHGIVHRATIKNNSTKVAIKFIPRTLKSIKNDEIKISLYLSNLAKENISLPFLLIFGHGMVNIDEMKNIEMKHNFADKFDAIKYKVYYQLCLDNNIDPDAIMDSQKYIANRLRIFAEKSDQNINIEATKYYNQYINELEKELPIYFYMDYLIMELGIGDLTMVNVPKEKMEEYKNGANCALNKLHQYNICHEDAHVGNFMLVNYAEDLNMIAIYDFGESKFYNKQSDSKLCDDNEKLEASYIEKILIKYK